MEESKLLQSYELAEKACALLRSQPRLSSYEHADTASAPPLASLQGLLRDLLAPLTILHAFEQDRDAVHAQVYKVLTTTIAEVTAMTTADAATEGAGPPGGNDLVQRSRAKEVEEGGAGGPHHRASSAEGEASSSPQRDAAAPTQRTPSTGSTDDATAGVAVAAVRPSLRWSDVQGCSEAITALQQAVLLPRRFPFLFSGTGVASRRPWQRLLLYGPPGTGKTLLAHATAAEVPNCRLVNLSSADVLSKWVGESEKLIRSAFAEAAKHEQCVLFLDEVDALCGSRGASGETEVARRLKTELLLHLQELPRSVTVLAATNLPWEIDSAVLRRFDSLVYVGLPDSGARRQLVRRGLDGVDHALRPRDVEWVVRHTRGYSASDVVRALSHAAMAPLRSLLDATRLRLATDSEIAAHRSRRDGVDDTPVIGEEAAEEEEDVPRRAKRKRRHADSAKSRSPPMTPSVCSAVTARSGTVAGESDRPTAPLPPQSGMLWPTGGTLKRITLPKSIGARGARALDSAVVTSSPVETTADEAKRTAAVGTTTTTMPSDAPPTDVYYVPCSPNDPQALLPSLTAITVSPASILVPPLTAAHVRDTLGEFIPTVRDEDVQRFTDWRHAQRR